MNRRKLIIGASSLSVLVIGGFIAWRAKANKDKIGFEPNPEFIDKAKKLINQNPLIDTHAVSYTHLDVYKRQILVDATKFEEPSGNVVCELSEIDTVITDDRLTDKSAKMLANAGIKLIIA